MSIGAGVVVAVAFQEVDGPPDAQARAQGDNESLKDVDRGREKCHNKIAGSREREGRADRFPCPGLLSKIVSYRFLKAAILSLASCIYEKPPFSAVSYSPEQSTS